MSDELSTKEMMKRIMHAVEDVQTRQTYIEKRAMNENMLPHEALRMFDKALNEFNTTSDPSWPLRKFRDIALSYWRALSVKYAGLLKEQEQEREREREREQQQQQQQQQSSNSNTKHKP